ncbi:hypothetical protein PpBr36_03087 [Pyricularia pennisetigena]|uniref:hypothetical protein n=1 Tax=Pyricularia pennisetigena TaxID=1578925 RepID=UPI00115292B1|nr:hypothetical protein PpBr36_03087 [Pyricularia pennisetigena]TLS31334.1 hypothetical protein PpBr36_03087 [Pyricularia pennisetigena]
MVLEEPFPLRSFAQRTTAFAPTCNADRIDRDTWVTSSSVNSRRLPGVLPVSVPPAPEQTSTAVALWTFACAPEQPYSMRRFPSKEGLQAMLSRIIAGDVTVEGIRATPASPARIQNIYTICLAGGQQLVLATAPSTMVRLLRSEQLLIESEALLLGWLREKLTRDKLVAGKVGVAADPRNGNTQYGNYPGSTAEDKQPMVTVPNNSVRTPKVRSPSSHVELLDILPTTISSSIADALVVADIVETSYLISQQPSGRFITADNINREAQQEHHVDIRQIEFQAGTIVRQLSRTTAPTGQFGPAVVVLGCPVKDGNASASEDHRPAASLNNNNNTWSRAFQSMMEDVLRDAEDMVIHIPYATIRTQMRRLCQYLNVVTTPRLVLIDAGEPTNLLVRTRCVSLDDKACASTSFSNQQAIGSQGLVKQLGVAGLADWSNAYFGDPLFTKTFSRQPSRSFLEGFYGSMESADGHFTMEKENSGCHQDTSGVRILLYSCYHLTVSIVQEYYRPRQGSTQREMEARRKLGEVLARLAAVGVVDESRGMGWQASLDGLTATPSGLEASSPGADWSSGQYTCRAGLRS